MDFQRIIKKHDDTKKAPLSDGVIRGATARMKNEGTAMHLRGGGGMPPRFG